MTPPQLLALDLDGTVVEPLHSVRPAVVDAVARARAAGVRVTLVTGRMYAGAAPFAKLLGIEGPIVCYQGAVIADAVTGRFAFELPLPNAVAMRVYAAAKPLGYTVQFYADDRFYVEEINRYSELYARVSGVAPVVVPSLPRAFAGKDSTKVNVVTDADRAAACAKLLVRTLGSDGYVTRSNPQFVEVLNPAVDKGRALLRIAEQYGIAPEAVLAIGDSYNDVPLLRAAGFAVAMGSAPPELVAEADAVVGDVEHDGVAEAIERFVLRPRDAEGAA